MGKRIGLIDVDGHNYPNLALMKLSSWHTSLGDNVEWYSIFSQYDIVYMSKVFTHKPDYTQVINNAGVIIKGGTGYDIESKLPVQCEKVIPDYSLYPYIDSRTAYGFLTRGCIRKCPWCIVPKKEGRIKPYQDIDELAVNGRNRIILMDNNILAAGDYGREQLEKIAEKQYRIDFNQAMDARLVTDDYAKLIARIKWIDYIRFACDTPKQIEECTEAIKMIQGYGYGGRFFVYTILRSDIEECYKRVSYFRENPELRAVPFAQPEINFGSGVQNIPQWQKDMAHWADKKNVYKSIDFMDFEPRKGFRCREYFDTTFRVSKKKTLREFQPSLFQE